MIENAQKTLSPFNIIALMRNVITFKDKRPITCVISLFFMDPF